MGRLVAEYPAAIEDVDKCTLAVQPQLLLCSISQTTCKPTFDVLYVNVRV